MKKISKITIGVIIAVIILCIPIILKLCIVPNIDRIFEKLEYKDKTKIENYDEKNMKEININDIINDFVKDKNEGIKKYSNKKYIISLDLTDAEIEEFIYTNDKDQEIKTNLLGEIWNYSNDEKYTVITYFYADRNKDFEDWNNWNTKKMQEKYGLDKFKNAKEIKFIAYIPDLNYLKEDEENIIDLGVEDIIDVK